MTNEEFNTIMKSSIPTRISSTDQLHSVMSDIQLKNPGIRLVFRGQRRNFEPLPSAQRHIEDAAYRRVQEILHSTWHHACSYLLQKYSVSEDPFQRLLSSMALLQHYGFRSWFVDVTSDPEIAAWFATHRYVSERILVYPHPSHSGQGPSPYLCDHALAVVSTARYERSTDADGFLLVFGVPDHAPNAFFLNEILSPSALRVQRQKAGELVAPMDGQPLISLLLATFVIDSSIKLPEHLSTRWLFPPALEDDVYEKLLRVPYVVSEDHLEQSPLLARPALIDVPLYIYDKQPDVKSLAHTRIVVGVYQPPIVLEPGRTVIRLPVSQFRQISYSTSFEPPNELLPPEGTNVILRMRQSPLRQVNLSVWPSKQLMLLYPVHQMLVTFMYRETVYPLFRGLIVDIVDVNNVHIAAIGEDLDYLRKEDFDHEDKAPFLEDFYFLTEQLEVGEATLVPKGNELHFEWVGWENRTHDDPLSEIRKLYSRLSQNNASTSVESKGDRDST